MINQTTKDKISELQRLYASLNKGNENLLWEIALANIPQMVCRSNAIENTTLCLEATKHAQNGRNLMHCRKELSIPFT